MHNRNKPGDTVRVDIHGWNGELIDRMKAKSNEKHKGALIVHRLKDIFDLSEGDIHRSVKEEQDKPEVLARPRPFSNEWRRPIRWKRDARGNII